MRNKHIFRVHVDKTDNNYCACLSCDDINGVVVQTAKTFDVLKKEFPEGLRFHIEGCIEHGDKLPEWIVKGDYEIVYFSV